MLKKIHYYYYYYYWSSPVSDQAKIMSNRPMEDSLKKIWKTNQSTKINLIGCDTIVYSPSIICFLLISLSEEALGFQVKFCSLN